MACLFGFAAWLRTQQPYAAVSPLSQLMGVSYGVTAPLVLPAAAGFFLTAWVSIMHRCQQSALPCSAKDRVPLPRRRRHMQQCSAVAPMTAARRIRVTIPAQGAL